MNIIFINIETNKWDTLCCNPESFRQNDKISDDKIMLYFSGPKNVDNVFGDEELIPFCKFCFAKKFKISALNIAETVTTVPELMSLGL